MLGLFKRQQEFNARVYKTFDGVTEEGPDGEFDDIIVMAGSFEEAFAKLKARTDIEAFQLWNDNESIYLEFARRKTWGPHWESCIPNYGN